MTKMQKYESQEMAVSAQQHMQAEVDMQVATAKRYPRSVSQCIKNAITMATASEEIAQSCFYALERGGKTIFGPSIRLAEIIASTWGHIRAESKIIEEGEKTVVARGSVWDMESNVMIAQEARRSIVTKHGRRYGNDMINTTSNAAISIALRNALFRIVPGAVVDAVYQEARAAAQGSKKPLKERRQQLLSAYSKLTVSQEQIEYFLGKPADKIGEADVDKMRGVYNALKDGEITVEDWLASFGWYNREELEQDQENEILNKLD